LEISITIVLFFIVGSIWLSYVLNRILLRFSTNLGTRKSGEVRFASTAKPSVGGFTFYIIFLLAFICTLFLFPQYLAAYTRETAGLFAACTLGFLLGLFDDAYNTKPALKFTGQFICGMILVFSDLYINIVPPGISGSMTYNTIFTLIWVIGMMNSINMLDNMDAVATTTSISILSCGLFVVFYLGLNDVFYTLVIIAVIGSLIGFLIYNWYPAKIYMGDTGSQFLGILLAIVGSRFLWPYRTADNEILQIKQFLIPGLAFLMPVVDTVTVCMRRISRGQSPFVGGADHTTHHLAFLGVPVPWVALIFGGMGLFSMAGVFLVLHVEKWTFVYSYLVIAYCLSIFLLMQLLYDLGSNKKPPTHEVDTNELPDDLPGEQHEKAR
jgi:UDP-GlcNAc:undecaprenyl-phosphate/decaprenyl-phosphate GlcNAc-1-phosphate transferase